MLYILSENVSLYTPIIIEELFEDSKIGGVVVEHK